MVLSRFISCHSFATVQRQCRLFLFKDLPAVIAAMVEAAKAGDPAAARLLLDRVVPAIRPESCPVPPGLHLTPDAIVHAVERGVLTQDQASDLMTLLMTRVKIGDAGETGERLERIEVLLRRPGELDRKF